jgi:hypothetical protein
MWQELERNAYRILVWIPERDHLEDRGVNFVYIGGGGMY